MFDDDMAVMLVKMDCTLEAREEAAELIRQQRQMLRRMVDAVFACYYADDLKEARRDVMGHASCDECGGTAGHPKGCGNGLRSVLIGFEHMNRKTRDALGLNDGQRLTAALDNIKAERTAKVSR